MSLISCDLRTSRTVKSTGYLGEVKPGVRGGPTESGMNGTITQEARKKLQKSRLKSKSNDTSATTMKRVTNVTHSWAGD